MIPGIILAMPVGSTWRVYHHGRQLDLGEITVLAHRRSGIELYLALADQRVTLPYPANDRWGMTGDHIRVLEANGALKATYAPA